MLFLFVLMLVGVDSPPTRWWRPSRASAGRPRRCAARLRDPADRGHRPRRARRASTGSARRTPAATSGPRRPDLHQVRLRVRDHRRPADHLGARRDGARPPRAHRARQDPAELAARSASRGEHLHPAARPGVYARHNAVDTPALLPDGTPSELSVNRDAARPRSDPRRRASHGASAWQRSEPDRAGGHDQGQRERDATDPARPGGGRSEPGQLPVPVGDLVHHRRRRRADPAQRDRRVHVHRADAQRPQPGVRHLLPACTATWTARSSRSS